MDETEFISITEECRFRFANAEVYIRFFPESRDLLKIPDTLVPQIACQNPKHLEAALCDKAGPAM